MNYFKLIRLLVAWLALHLNIHANAQLQGYYNSIGSIPSKSTPISDVTNNIVGWWKFDENGGTNAADSSGFNNNGYVNYITNSLATEAWWALGYIGQASFENFAGNYAGCVLIPNSTNYQFGTSDFTLSAFIDSDKTDVRVAIGKYNLSGDVYWMGLFPNGYASVSVNAVTLTNQAPINDGLWHMLTATRTGGNLFFYVDAICVASNAMTDSVSPGGVFNIGGFGEFSASFTWIGLIDDVRVYSRGLSSSEISTVFNIPKTFSIIANSNAVKILPPGNVTKLIQYVGGHDEYSYSVFTDPISRNNIYALLTNGWGFVSASGGIDSWGNGFAMNAHTNALIWATNGMSLSKLAVISQSMGGLAGLNIMSIFTNITRWYGIYPACSLSNMFYNSSVQFSNEIKTAYGFSNPSDFLTATAGHDPMTLATNLFGHAQYKAIASAADTVVPRVGNAEFATNRIVWMTLTNSVGNHGDASNFNPEDVLGFLNN